MRTMVVKSEYDFLPGNWTSFPSSAKLFSNEGRIVWVWWPTATPSTLPVTPGSTLTVEAKAKRENVLYGGSHIPVEGWDGKNWRRIWVLPGGIGRAMPRGTFDWQTFLDEFPVPSDITVVRCRLAGGSGTPEAPGLTWFDDLRVYQDEQLIYADDFSNWNPIIGAGLGAGVLGVAVPAVVRVPEPGVAYEYQKPLLEKEPLLAAGLAGLGALVGGGVGLLTALGLVPVPQIPQLPTLEAPPEGARLGTYVVRG